jgi:hypothetical protein
LHGIHPTVDSAVLQKHPDDRRQSPSVSAPGQVQTGQIGQKIVFNFELADLAVKFVHLGYLST